MIHRPVGFASAVPSRVPHAAASIRLFSRPLVGIAAARRRASPWALLIGGLLIAAPPEARAVTHLWSQSFGDGDYQVANSVATDGSGNVIVTGYFSGTVDFGGGDLTAIGGDAYLAKFSSAGVHQWSYRFGDAGDPTPTSVATDASGNVIITGHFSGTVNFGGADLTCNGLNDIFLAKFNAAGVHQWSKQFGNSSWQAGYSVTTDASGNVLLLSNCLGSVDFGDGTLTSAGFNDIFLAKFNAAGVHQWSKRFGDADDQLGTSVAADASGNVILAGWYNGTLDFGGEALTSAGVGDVCLAKFDPAGAHLWSKRFGSTNDQYAYGVAADASGNVVLTGGFYGTIDFGGGALTSAGSVDLYVAKFNSAGTHQWSQSFGDGSDQYGYSVASDGSGSVFVTGSADGTVDFGGGPLTTGGGGDVFVAKFNSAGVHQWSGRFGDAASQTGQSAATDGNGDVVVAGGFDGVVDFGGGNRTSAGSNDIFVAKFGGSVTAVGDAPRTAGLSLSSFPNPLRSETTIRFTVPSAGRVTVEVYDIRGARIATLVDERMNAGAHAIAWNRRDARARDAGPGVYLARVRQPRGTTTCRMIVLR